MKRYIELGENGAILSYGIYDNVTFSDALKKGRNLREVDEILSRMDVEKKVINGKIVNKTIEEIEAEKPIKPTPIPTEQQRANITNEQLQDILNRLNKLEGK